MSDLNNKIDERSAAKMLEMSGKTVSQVRFAQVRDFAQRQATARSAAQEKQTNASLPKPRTESVVFNPPPLQVTAPDPVRTAPGGVGTDGTPRTIQFVEVIAGPATTTSELTVLTL